MRFRLITMELLRQRKRVRLAEQLVRQDKAATARARRRFTRNVLASPVGLSVCASTGFLFDRLRGSSGGRASLDERLRLIVAAAFWVQRAAAALHRHGSAAVLTQASAPSSRESRTSAAPVSLP